MTKRKAVFIDGNSVVLSEGWETPSFWFSEFQFWLDFIFIR